MAWKRRKCLSSVTWLGCLVSISSLSLMMSSKGPGAGPADRVPAYKSQYGGCEADADDRHEGGLPGAARAARGVQHHGGAGPAAPEAKHVPRRQPAAPAEDEASLHAPRQHHGEG